MNTPDIPESRTRQAQERLRDSLREERDELLKKSLTAEEQKLLIGYNQLLERFAFLETRH